MDLSALAPRVHVHRLVPVPRSRLRRATGIRIGPDQRAWSCSCDDGWLTVGIERPVDAHARHVEAAKAGR